MSHKGGLKICRRCWMAYPPSALWCPRCYDADGQPRVPPQSTSPVREQPRSALSLLAAQIEQAGYWPNVTDIAYGRRVEHFPQSLALAVIYHDPRRSVEPEMEALAREWLARLFHIEAEVCHVPTH